MYEDYKMIVDEPNSDLGRIFFIATYHPKDISMDIKVNITCRSNFSYPSIPINPDWQYLEIGSGIAEFMPSIYSIVKKKPFVIDMVDYGAIAELLKENTFEHQSLFKLSEILKNRLDVYRDPTKINLINKSVGDAAKDSFLHGIADVVIDWAGAGTYADTEFELADLKGDRKMLRERIEKKIECYEKLFLKPGGLYITSPSFKR